MNTNKKSQKQIQIETFLHLNDQVTVEDIYNIDHFFQHANQKQIKQNKVELQNIEFLDGIKQNDQIIYRENMFKDRFSEKEWIDWGLLKQIINMHEDQNGLNGVQQTSNESLQEEEIEEFELKIHCKKNHLILLLDVSPSMFKYDYITNSLNIQNLEIICKSLLDHILEAAHNKNEEANKNNSENHLSSQDLEYHSHHGYPLAYKQRTRITVYLFGMSNKELELVVNYVILSQDNINEIYKQILKSILENCNKMSNRQLNAKSSRQTSPRYSPVNSYNNKQSGTSATRLSGGSDYLQSQNYSERRCTLDMIDAISRIQQNLVIHGEKISFTKLVVITDGVSLDVDDEKFYQQISRTVKPIGFSCHILLTGKSQLNRENQFGYIVDEDMLKFIASKMNGEFHFLTVHDEMSNNNKTKSQYAYFACCKGPQNEFSKMIKQMLMTWTLRYNLKDFRYSFYASKSQNSSARHSMISSQHSIRDESSIREDKEEDQCTIIYTEESKDEYNLKFKKIIKLVHKYDLKPHVSLQVDKERLYQISKIRHLEGWKMIRVQKRDNFVLGYEYRVNLQAKLYYLIKCVNQRFKILIYQDVPAISVKDRRDQSISYKTPEYITNISRKLEQYDQFAFNSHNLMQYNFDNSNKKQTKVLCNSKAYKETNMREDKKDIYKDQEELWEKYYKVKTLTFLQIPKDKVCKDNIGSMKNKFSQEVYERVSYIADKNITKNKFYLKINKDFVHLLEESKQDKQAQLIHQQSAMPSGQGEKSIFALNQKGFSVDENLMDYGKILLENQDSDGQKLNGLTGLQHRISQGGQINQYTKENQNQYNPIKSLAYIKVSMKNLYVTEIKLAFQNYPKEQQKQLVKDIKKTIHHYNFEFFDISVISNSINLLLYMGQANIYPFQEASNLSKSWQWTQECIHDLKHFYSVLVSLRKNGQFKSIQLNRSQYKETIFLTEVQFQRSENTKKIKRILIAHIITFKKNLIEVKLVCENALDLVQIPGKGYLTAQKVLQQYITHIYQQEEKIMKRLYTVHTIHRHAIAKRKDSNNQDVFVGIVLDSLKVHMLAHLNMGISMLRDDTENIKDISSYKKHLENILKEEYQKFDVTKENFIEYNALFQNSYLKKTFAFQQIEGATSQDQEYLKQCLEYIQQNNDHSVMNAKKSYLIDVKENSKGYINCKFLDYKVVLISYLYSEDETTNSNQQSSQADGSTQMNSSKIGSQQQSNNNTNVQASSVQNNYNLSPKLNPHHKDINQPDSLSNLSKRDLSKEGSNKKLELNLLQQQQQAPQLSSFNTEVNRKLQSRGLQFKIDFYLMDIKSNENNTNPTSRDFEKYHKGIDQYIEQLTKQINHFYSQTCFEVIASKKIKLNYFTVEGAIHNLGMQPQIQLIPLKEFIPIYSWFHKDLATQKKKFNQNVGNMSSTISMNTGSIPNQINTRNNSNLHHHHHHHINKQNAMTSSNIHKNQQNQSITTSLINEDMNYLVNPKCIDEDIMYVDPSTKSMITLSSASSNITQKKMEKEINPFEQFDTLVLTKAQKIFDIVVNHFFSNIPDTPYYFSDQKKAEELRRNDPQDYDLAMEFLPNVNQVIPKIFMKIKYNLSGEQRYFSSLKETFKSMINETNKDKDNNNILFEFYQIQNDLFKENKQQISTLGNDPQPQSNTATKKANNFFFDFKLACSNIIKIINLEYFMINTPLSSDEIDKIIKLISESKQNYQRVYEMERKKLINLEDYKLLDNPKSQEILIGEINEESNQGCLHLKEKISGNQYMYYQIFSSPSDDECSLLDSDTRDLFKRINEYTSYIVPFWFFLIFQPNKIEVHFHPISFLSQSQSHFIKIQQEINSFIQKVYYRANTIILTLDMKRNQLCPQNLEIKGAQMQKQESKAAGTQNKISKNQFFKQFNLNKTKPENKENTQDKIDSNKKYKVDLLDTLYFPLQEKDEISTLLINMVFNNFRIHNTTNTYLYFEKDEIYILCFQEVNQHQLNHHDQTASVQQGSFAQNSLINQSNDSFISQNQTGSQADSSFLIQAHQYIKTEINQKGSLIQNPSQSFNLGSGQTTIRGPLSKYYTMDEYNKGKKFIKIEIYGMSKRQFHIAQEAQTLETIKKIGGKLSDAIRISKTDYDQIQNGKQRKKFRYKFPSFIVDHASFMYYFKQNIEKIMQRFNIVHRSFQGIRPQVLDQIKESQESANDLQNPNVNTPKKENQQFDQFLTDNYGEMKVIKVQYDKNDFRFLCNAQSSRQIFGICMFLMNVVLQRRKQSRELEEVNHFYPVVPLKQIQDNQKLGLNFIETISLGCGYSQNDWDDQSSFVYNFLANNQQIDSFKSPDIFTYIENKQVKEKTSEFKIELASEIMTQEEYFLDLEIRNKGTVEEEKLIMYLTEMLNQICLDYLFETILQRSIVANLDEKNQNKRIQYEYFYKSCLNAEKLFQKLNHKSFFMYHQKYQHKSYHVIWPSYLKYCSSLLEKEIQEKCKWTDLNVVFPSIYVIDDGSGYPQIFESYYDMEIYFSGNYKNSISILKKPPSISYIMCGNLLQQGIRDGKYDKSMLKIFEKLKEDQGVQLTPVEKQEFEIFTQRNFYARIVISQRNLELNFYNFNYGIIKQMTEYMETFSSWQNCRYHIQKHVLLQKLGVYTHFSSYNVAKKKPQNQSFIDEIHKILTSEERTGDLSDLNNFRTFLRERQQDQNEKRVKEGIPEKLTEFISTMTYNIFPQKNRERMLDMFEKHYNNFLLVSFRIIKPKFTKSHYSKKQNDDENIDSLIIHGGPFLNFVQDFYINDYNKQYFKYMRSSCQAGNQKFLDFQLIKKFLNGADLVRTDICPIIMIIADNNQFNHWKRREVDESDVVGDHLDFLEKEENKKMLSAYQLFQDIYIEQIEKLVNKANYIIKQKLDVYISDYSNDPSQSFLTMKKGASQFENDKFQLQKYKKLSLGQFNRISQSDEQTSININLVQSKDSNLHLKQPTNRLTSFNDSKNNITILLKVHSKTLFLVDLQFKASEVSQRVYYQSQDKTDQFELIQNQEINIFQKECNLTKEIFEAHLNLIYQVLQENKENQYPDLDIVQTLNQLQSHYSGLIDMSKSNHIIESRVVQATLGYFNSNFSQKEFIDFFDQIIKSNKLSSLYKVGSNICMQINKSLYQDLIVYNSSFFIFVSLLTDEKTLQGSKNLIQLQIETSLNINQILYISYHVIAFDANQGNQAVTQRVLNDIHQEIEKIFREILPRMKRAYISQDYYNGIISAEDKTSNEYIDLLQNNCQLILLQQKNPDYLKEIKDLTCFDQNFLEYLRWMFKNTKYTNRDKFNCYNIFIPIQDESITFQGAILLNINDKNQIDVDKIKCISVYELNEQDFISIMYKNLNEIVLNWIYYLNECPYQVDI